MIFCIACRHGLGLLFDKAYHFFVKRELPPACWSAAQAKGSFFDHMTSHRAAWSTWNSCFQRVPESKRKGAKTATDIQKELEKSFPNSLGPSGREFESPISGQKPSEINDFRGLFFVTYCGAVFEVTVLQLPDSLLADNTAFISA